MSNRDKKVSIKNPQEESTLLTRSNYGLGQDLDKRNNRNPALCLLGGNDTDVRFSLQPGLVAST